MFGPSNSALKFLSIGSVVVGLGVLATAARADIIIGPTAFNLQAYTVPATGIYDITAYGAQGWLGGYGAVIGGDVKLTVGETLAILVGFTGGSPGELIGGPPPGNGGGGGGGGTFVVLGNTPLVVAGGGGGEGVIGGNGGAGPGIIVRGGPGLAQNINGGNAVMGGLGGLDGLGGSGGNDGGGGGGGGFYGNGGNALGAGGGGLGNSFVSGGACPIGGELGNGGGGGCPFGYGGGGGGGVLLNNGIYYGGGGGGGGYSGGAGGDAGSGGAGGGSFLSSLVTPEIAIDGGNTGLTGGNNRNGWVDISFAASGAVPEPSTWAMLFLGFAGLGFAGYRRARVAVSAA